MARGRKPPASGARSGPRPRVRPCRRLRSVSPRERIRRPRRRSRGARWVALRASRVRALRLRAVVRRSDRLHLAPSRTRSRWGARPAGRPASERRARGRRRVGVGEVRRGDGAGGASRGSESGGRPGSTDTATSGGASGRDWEDYLHSWARSIGSRGRELLRVLDERLVRRSSADGPYFFSDLPGMTESRERAAIEAGAIRAVRIDWVGTRP